MIITLSFPWLDFQQLKRDSEHNFIHPPTLELVDTDLMFVRYFGAINEQNKKSYMLPDSEKKYISARKALKCINMPSIRVRKIYEDDLKYYSQIVVLKNPRRSRFFCPSLEKRLFQSGCSRRLDLCFVQSSTSKRSSYTFLDVENIVAKLFSLKFSIRSLCNKSITYAVIQYKRIIESLAVLHSQATQVFPPDEPNKIDCQSGRPFIIVEMDEEEIAHDDQRKESIISDLVEVPCIPHEWGFSLFFHVLSLSSVNVSMSFPIWFIVKKKNTKLKYLQSFKTVLQKWTSDRALISLLLIHLSCDKDFADEASYEKVATFIKSCLAYINKKRMRGINLFTMLAVVNEVDEFISPEFRERILNTLKLIQPLSYLSGVVDYSLSKHEVTNPVYQGATNNYVVNIYDSSSNELINLRDEISNITKTNQVSVEILGKIFAILEKF